MPTARSNASGGEWLHTDLQGGRDEDIPALEDRRMTALAAHAPIMAALVDISSPKGAPWEFLILFATLLLGPVLFKRARRARHHRAAAGRLRDRPTRAQPDRLGQRHAARPRSARAAVSDVRRRRRARPEPAAHPSPLDRRLRTAHVRLPDDARHDRRPRARLGSGGRAAARLAAGLAHAHHLPDRPRGGPFLRSGRRHRGGIDGADRHARADRARGRRRLVGGGRSASKWPCRSPSG